MQLHIEPNIDELMGPNNPSDPIIHETLHSKMTSKMLWQGDDKRS